MNSKQKTKIEFLTECYGWDEGFVTTIEDEDDINIYFNDVWGRWTYIEKSLEGLEFQIIDKTEPKMMCGGKDVTYPALKKRAEELKKSRE